MAVITMTFARDINSSVQVGDMIYKAALGSYGETGSLVEVGTVTAVTSTTVSCNIATGDGRPTANDFILFSKDNKANLSTLKGYYAEVELKNNSLTSAEVYAVGSEIFESSK